MSKLTTVRTRVGGGLQSTAQSSRSAASSAWKTSKPLVQVAARTAFVGAVFAGAVDIARRNRP